MEKVYFLNLRNIYTCLKTDKVSYWLILFYLFIEYFRPQTLYPLIDILPFGMLAISSCLIVFLFEGHAFSVGNTANKLMVTFVVVILLSSISGMSFEHSASYWYVFFSWLLIYFLIINIVNTESRFLLFTFLFILCSFKMAQFSVRGWIAGGRGYSTYGFGGGPGWFHNSGEFGIQMCVYFPIAFYFYMALKEFWPKWKKMAFALFPLTGLTGMISSSNRGTLVGGAAVVIWMFLKSKYKFKAIFALVLVAFLAFNFIPEKQIERFQQAGKDQTSVSRIENWKKGLKIAEMYPVLGVGYKNWQIADRKLFYGDGLMAHNIFIECVSELGYAGLAVFILLIFVTLKNNSKTRNLVMTNNNIENKFIYYMAHALDAALIGYLVSGFFITVLYYPYFWINLSMAVALNNIARLNYGADSVHDSR